MISYSCWQISSGDPILLVEGHYVLGVTLSWAGSFTRSRIHLEQALAHYDPTSAAAHIARYSQDPNVICQCRLAFDLWCLGYPEQAEAVQHRGLAQARALAHPFSLAYALFWDGLLHGAMGNVSSLLRSAEACLALSDQHHFGLWLLWARCCGAGRWAKRASQSWVSQNFSTRMSRCAQ